MPTHQYMPIPNYAVEQAISYGKELKQTWERPGSVSYTHLDVYKRQPESLLQQLSNVSMFSKEIMQS